MDAISHEDDGGVVVRVLVVEDDPAIARAIRRLLAAPGLRIECAYDAQSALASIEAAAPEIVWSDLDLGSELDGIDVLFAAARRRPEAGLLLVTSDPGAVGARALPAGARVFHKTDLTDPLTFVRQCAVRAPAA